MVNLGDGLRVVAKKPHVTKEDVAEAKESAEETKRKHEGEVTELMEKDKAVEDQLQMRLQLIEDRMR